MTKLLRAGLVALLGFAAATPALASKAAPAPSKGEMKVDDAAGVFDKDSVIKAEAKFNGVTFKSATHVKVATFQNVPQNRKADFDKALAASTGKDSAAKRAYMRDWARELANAETERGVFVLVCVEAKSVEVVSDRQADLYRHFNDDDCKAMAERIAGGFKEAEKLKTDDEKRAARGQGLVRGTEYLIGQVKGSSAPDGATGSTRSDGGGEKSGGWPIWMWVVVILGILLFVWVIIALIRAMTGNVYGGGYGGGGYGGGGPGFFGCFMGGMFGAMAGMWMYNSMMGTHYSHDPGTSASDTGAADGGATDTGAGDYDNGAAGGADWGDSGGDAGGGGGDWGADAGGGGDWGGDGGGGGDFGGGGDW